MISIDRATLIDYKTIATIGRISVAEAHRDSCSAKDLDEFIARNYNDEAIKNELREEQNIYNIISSNGEPAGFSKIVYNSRHQNIQYQNVTKLDRIYLSSKFFNKKLGLTLLNYIIDLSKRNNQVGIWLFTWTGNKKAIHFYEKNGFKIIGSHKFQITETHSNPNHQMFLNYQ